MGDSTGASKQPDPIGFSVRMETASAHKEARDAEEAPTSLEIDRFKSIHDAARGFRENMKNLWRYSEGIGTAARFTAFVNFVELTHLLLQLSVRNLKSAREPIATFVVEVKYATDPVDAKPADEMRLPVTENADLELCSELIFSSDCAHSLVHQTTLQQSVVLFERLLGEIIFHASLADSKNIYEDEQLAARDILEMQSFDQAKEAAAYQQTERFLKATTTKQLDFFKDKFKVDLYRLCKNRIPDLRECILRRHLIVHGTSFSSHEYWRKRRRIDGLRPPDEAESVHELTIQYVSKAWQATYAVGIVAVHAIMHRSAESSKTEEQQRSRVKQADGFLTHAAFVCIQMELYQAAEDILRYYLSEYKGGSSIDTYALMAKVNLAQALKWDGRDQECERELEQIDLSSLNLQFQLCVAALRQDDVEFQRILPRAAADDLISIPELLGWPVFKRMRERDDFRDWIAAAFGIEPEAIPRVRSAPLVLGPGPEAAEKAIQRVTTTVERLSAKLRPAEAPTDNKGV